MNVVQPIRDKKSIEAFKSLLLATGGKRDYMMFVVGINTGLRISDILKLKVKDVRGKSHLLLKEKKTSKFKRFLINSNLKKEFGEYTKYMKDNEYLFQSRKGDNKPISRIQAYRILNQAATTLGLEEVGTHTLRKTFGYWHYKQFKDVRLLQYIFNHSDPSITLRYIGMYDDMVDETIVEFSL